MCFARSSSSMPDRPPSHVDASRKLTGSQLQPAPCTTLPGPCCPSLLRLPHACDRAAVPGLAHSPRVAACSPLPWPPAPQSCLMPLRADISSGAAAPRFPAPASRRGRSSAAGAALTGRLRGPGPSAAVLRGSWLLGHSSAAIPHRQNAGSQDGQTRANEDPELGFESGSEVTSAGGGASTRRVAVSTARRSAQCASTKPGAASSSSQSG